MSVNTLVVAICRVVTVLFVLVLGHRAGGASAQAQSATTDDPVKVLVGRLDLERYKATIKALTQFGDRQQGTDRNRAAIDWIEVQLRSYGCTNTERIKYVYNPPSPAQAQQSAAIPPSSVISSGEIRTGAGGSRLRGITRPAGPNNDPDAQTDLTLRALNSQTPTPGPRGKRVLHEDRYHPPRRNVHSWRPHGRAWLWRSRE